MKNILIYINDSLGELDWIAPFIKSSEGKEFSFHIFLNGPGVTYQDKINILEKYGLDKKNVLCINSESKKDYYLYKIDEFFNRVLGRTKLISYSGYVVSRKIVDFVRLSIGSLHTTSDCPYEYIFRDYNLKDSISFMKLKSGCKNAKIVVFPHAVGLQKIHTDCPREALRKINIDLWLENSDLSDIAKKDKFYRNKFFASGAPAFDINYKLPTLFSAKVKKVLLITRDCSITFGFDYASALKAFSLILKELNVLGYSVYIKHHPRDRRLNDWRKLQEQYPNAKELNQSLTTISDKYSACLTLFSTAPLFLLSRQIPVFEFSPYKTYKFYNAKLPMHYSDKNGLLTHDLLELGLYERLDDLSKLRNYLHENSLSEISKLQYQKCQKIFIKGANANIANKLMDLRNE